MTTAQFSLGAVVLAPLLLASISVLLPARSRYLAGLGAVFAVAMATWPVIMAVAAGHPVELAAGGYDAPVGITLRADGLSALFLLLTTVIGALVTAYAALVPASTGQRLVTPASASGGAERHELEWRAGHPAFWPLWLGCWSGLNAVFVSGDLFNTYVGLELVALTAVGLVALGGGTAWRAALRYLFVAVAGAMLFLVGVALIVAVTGTLDISQASEVIRDDSGTHPAAALALVLMTVGLAMKIALVPMHGWLIPAHSNAPGAVSPLLSALVIKASLFVLLRLWIWLAAPAVLLEGEPAPAASVLEAVTAVLGWGLAALGVAAVVIGSLLALRQDRLKPLVAYSTVAQVGYWFLFFPILVDRESDLLEEQAVTTLADDAVVAGAVTGTVALALGHGVAKAAVFLVAGHLKHVYGTDELSRLRGVGTRHPWLTMSLGLAAVGLVGLPFSLAFSGKWELSTSAVAAGEMWILAVVVLATLLSAAYLLRMMSPLLRAADSGGEDEREPAPASAQTTRERAAQLVPFTLGTLTVLTGFTGFWVADMVEVGAPW